MGMARYFSLEYHYRRRCLAKRTGGLFYDANGNGAGGAIQLATLTNKPALTASDFVVI
jgi:hypothetical protein